jgi:NADPH:quinone reductase-like Zn-dependent oxidoreductase
MKSRCISIHEFGTADVVAISEREVPDPKGSEVRIRIDAASVSFTDIMIRNGRYPDVKKAPVVLGYDFVGQVEAVGPDVTRFSLGDRVADLTITGSQSEYILRDEAGLVSVPSELEPAQAVVCVLAYLTAYQMMFRVAELKEGDSFLIHGGSGSVGSAALDLARAFGISAYATASQSKRDFVSSFGATAIDYQHEDFVQVIKSKHPEGVPAVFDAIGPDNFKRSYSALSPGGSLVIFGMLDMALGRQKGGMLATGLWYGVSKLKRDRRNAVLYTITRLRKQHPDWFEQDLTALFELVRNGRIAPVVADIISFFDVAEAHRRIESADVRGKVVLDPRRR